MGNSISFVTALNNPEELISNMRQCSLNSKRVGGATNFMPSFNQLASSHTASLLDKKNDILLYACSSYATLAVKKLVKTYNADVNYKGTHGNTPLHKAVFRNDKDTVLNSTSNRI